jgi:hypothetical protein
MRISTLAIDLDRSDVWLSAGLYTLTLKAAAEILAVTGENVSQARVFLRMEDGSYHLGALVLADDRETLRLLMEPPSLAYHESRPVASCSDMTS